MQQKTTEREKSRVLSAIQMEPKAEELNRIQTILPEDYEINLSDFALFMSVMKVKEAVRMNILEIGIAKGEEIGLEKGREEGRLKNLVENVESAMKNFNIDLQQACAGLGTSVEEYEKARQYFLNYRRT